MKSYSKQNIHRKMESIDNLYNGYKISDIQSYQNKMFREFRNINYLQNRCKVNGLIRNKLKEIIIKFTFEI